MKSDDRSKSRARKHRTWLAAAMILVTALVVVLYFATGLYDVSNVRDEDLMKVPIDAILQNGWSIRTAIDYQEVKGPAFFWMYAMPAEAIGGGINSLRAISMAYFVLGAWALLLLARECGLGSRGLITIAVLYALSPYNTFTALLLMSEPSVTCVGLWLVFVFVRGMTAGEVSRIRRWAPFVFMVLLTILLHHRPHAVALGGAAVVTALVRDRARAWPWVLACISAGLLRLPLYLRWGGMVTSHYQDLFGFGVRLDGLTYMLAAILPWIAGWLIAPLFAGRTSNAFTLRRMTMAGLAGLLLGAFAVPDLDAKVQYTLPGSTDIKSQAEYAGVIATFLKGALPQGVARDLVMAIFAGMGAASLAGLFLTRPKSESQQFAHRDSLQVVLRLAFWTLACGLPLYLITSGPVYDRYLVVWVILLPIAWRATLPRWLLFVQVIAHAAMLVYVVKYSLVPA